MSENIKRVREMIRGGDLSQETLNKLADEVPDNAEEISTKVENMLKDAPEEMDTFKEVSDALSTMGGSGGDIEPIALALAARDIIDYDQFEAMTGKEMRDLEGTYEVCESGYDGDEFIGGEDVYYRYELSGKTNVQITAGPIVDGVVTLPQFAIKDQDDSTIYRIRSMMAYYGYYGPSSGITKVIVPYGYKKIGDWVYEMDGFIQKQYEIVLPDSIEELHGTIWAKLKNCYFSDSMKSFGFNNTYEGKGEASILPVPDANGVVTLSFPGGVSLGYKSFDLTYSQNTISTVNIIFRGIPKSLDAPQDADGGIFYTDSRNDLTINVYVPWGEHSDYNEQFIDALDAHLYASNILHMHYNYIS